MSTRFERKNIWQCWGKLIDNYIANRMQLVNVILTDQNVPQFTSNCFFTIHLKEYNFGS